MEFTALLSLLSPLAQPAKEILIREGAAQIARIFNAEELSEDDWAKLHAIRDRAEREARAGQP